MKLTNYKTLLKFTSLLFDRQEWAEKAALILQGILRARSPRLTDIARALPKGFFAGHKMLYRFLRRVPVKDSLLRLFPRDVPFVICDLTEIPRPQARKTSYVGTLKDGKTRGFQLLLLSVPHRGRAIPFHFLVLSSSTIAQGTSRNLQHLKAFHGVKEILGEVPLVLDREFSYGWLLSQLKEAGIHFVIRLNMGLHPWFTDKGGREMNLSLSPGKEILLQGLLYKGEVEVNVAGVWGKGKPEPLWIITDLDPKEGLRIYRKRMVIEESFRDLKGIFGLERMMNKSPEYLEKTLALVLLAYGVALLLGEEMRERLLGGTRWCRIYSGVFVLLKLGLRIDQEDAKGIVDCALSRFPNPLSPPVSSHV